MKIDIKKFIIINVLLLSANRFLFFLAIGLIYIYIWRFVYVNVNENWNKEMY